MWMDCSRGIEEVTEGSVKEKKEDGK